MKFIPGLVLTAVAATALGGDRINQEGRILGPAPVVTQPILFNTAEADAVVAAMQIMPVTSAWNEDVSRLPLLANSTAMIAQITSDLASNRRTLRAFYEMKGCTRGKSSWCCFYILWSRCRSEPWRVSDAIRRNGPAPHC